MTKVSVIVCSRKEDDAVPLINSIRRSCCLNDHEAELVEVVGATSMGAGYNEGLKRATGDVLVYTHSDVEMWAGRKLWTDMCLVTTDPGGFVGVAGTIRLGETAVWWNQEAYQGRLRGTVFHRARGFTYGSAFGPFGQAVVMDGVFLACHRKLAEEFRWDEGLGWHFYDIDMTLRVHEAGYHNQVIPLPILHHSIGPVGEPWKNSRLKFLKKHGSKLPVSL